MHSILATGMITVTEAAEMLDTTDHLNTSGSHELDVLKTKDLEDKIEGKPRWFHIKVSDMNTGKSTVTVKRNDSPDFSKINSAGLNDLIGSERATLIDSQDED
jgi:hypothetical protein